MGSIRFLVELNVEVHVETKSDLPRPGIQNSLILKQKTKEERYEIKYIRQNQTRNNACAN